MNHSFIAKILLIATGTIGIVIGGDRVLAEPTDYYTVNKQQVKSSVQYRCMEREGTPATVAYTSRGAIELIRWQNDYFSASSYTPTRRCQEVSTRFQNHSDANNLRFISTGKINNYNAICISEKTGSCKPDGLLLTLQPGENPEEVLRSLFNLRDRASRGGITRTSNSSRKIKETIDLDRFLANSPIIKGESEPTAIDEAIDEKKVIENPFDGL